ncbi:MAG: beta-galactosidase [Phycisphaerae bacterium]|nr:beta-galactosidase [Phycisphaerae bacterium]
MVNVTFDDRSYMIDNRRIWLVSGSIHYFRIPPDLWEDRLCKAKRAGLNCISTYVPWNFHEQREGKWDFSEQRDIVKFVELAGQMGLYVILRPGPFIGGDWDFGGFPAWLCGKSAVAYRTSNAAFTHYFDKFFAQLLPRLAEHQVTNGGNIILIQNENEYQVGTQPDRTTYLEFINQLFRRSGFTIPIINCNCQVDPDTQTSVMTDPATEDNVECINAGDSIVRSLRRLRTRQGSAPLMATELHCGSPDNWGVEHQDCDDRKVARRALEVLGCGAQLNYYMWCGGTNFEFFGSRLFTDCDSYQTTSYDYDAPVAEGGGLTRKYYLTRLVNVMATTMHRYFAAAKAPESAARVEDSTDTLNIIGSAGSWVVVTNNGDDEIEEVTVALPSGQQVEVRLDTLGAIALPYKMRLPTGDELNYTSLQPLGLFGVEQNRESVLVLHGSPKTKGVVSINAKELQVAIPGGKTPEIIQHGALTLVLMNSEMAMRTWAMDDSLIIGADYVGKDLEDVRFDAKTREYFVLSLQNSSLTKKTVKTEQHHKPTTAPRLGTWKRLCICPEPISKKLQWQKLDRPRSMVKLGVNYGYLWYRIDLVQEKPCKRYLYLPECADRASLYLNGSLLGVWGTGDDASREPIGVNLKKGSNVLVALVDNLGRYSSGPRMGEDKGLYGHVYDAKTLKPGKFKIKPTESFPKRIVPRSMVHLMKYLEVATTYEVSVDFPLTKVSPIHMTFSGIDNHVAVFCNNRPCGFFAKGETNWGEVTLGADLKKGKNTVKFLVWGEVDVDALERSVKFHTLNEPLSAGMKWSYRHWTFPDSTVGEPILGKSCWYAAKFKAPTGNEPLFAKIFGTKKGQLFLNGRNIGRFWSAGPQEYYYLPECWMQEENTLTIFAENGSMPTRCKLVHLPQGPFGR